MKTSFQDGRYEVLRPLGQGATSEVYEVLDTRLGARRALKRMVQAPNPAARKRQEREALIMARLDHPNVVTVIDAFAEDGQRCVVMELCEGGSLATRVELGGPLPAERVVAVGDALAHALAAAHASGVLHRDVKPQNILFGPTGDPRIGDFGLSWMSQDGETPTRTGALLGTVPFMAPELRRGEPHTEATDRYALAATLAWCATGTFPPDLDRVGALDGLPEPVAHFLGGLLAGDSRVLEGDLRRRRRSAKALRMGGGALAILAAGGAGWALRPAPDAEAAPQAGGVLSDYEALESCPREVRFASQDKYPHYNADPRLPEEAGGVALLDIDGDDDLDLVVPYVLGTTVDVFRNEDGALFRRDTDNVFEQPLRIEADVAAGTLTVGDIHGDGRNEALWLKRNRMGFQLLETDQDGEVATDLYGLGDPSATPVLVDTNGDGCDDLLYASRSLPPALRVRRSKCDGEFEVEAAYLEGWAGVAREGVHLVIQHADGRVARLDPATAGVRPIESGDLSLRVRGGYGLAVAGLPDGAHAIVGLDSDGGLCRGPQAKSLGATVAVGDVDGDGRVDRVRAMTCGYCTSMVMLDRGEPVSEGEAPGG